MVATCASPASSKLTSLLSVEFARFGDRLYLRLVLNPLRSLSSWASFSSNCAVSSIEFVMNLAEQGVKCLSRHRTTRQFIFCRLPWGVVDLCNFSTWFFDLVDFCIWFCTVFDVDLLIVVYSCRSIRTSFVVFERNMFVFLSSLKSDSF